MGTFVDERAAICYCAGYQWSHFASFKDALDVLNVDPTRLPRKPLIVDIGCGPGTAVMAFGEWLYGRRRATTDIGYIGIDRAQHMQRLATEFACSDVIFQPHRPLVVSNVEDLTADAVQCLARDRDGIVVLMSYVLHHPFMSDSSIFLELFGRLHDTRLPVHFLAQDANKPVGSPPVQVWPDNRLRAMLDAIEQLGYQNSDVRSKLFVARDLHMGEDWEPFEQPGDGKARTVAMSAQGWL